MSVLGRYIYRRFNFAERILVLFTLMQYPMRPHYLDLAFRNVIFAWSQDGMGCLISGYYHIGDVQAPAVVPQL